MDPHSVPPSDSTDHSSNNYDNDPIITVAHWDSVLIVLLIYVVAGIYLVGNLFNAVIDRHYLKLFIGFSVLIWMIYDLTISVIGVMKQKRQQSVLPVWTPYLALAGFIYMFL